MSKQENAFGNKPRRQADGISKIEEVLKNCHTVNYQELRKLIEGVYPLEKRRNYFFIKSGGKYVRTRNGKILRIPLSHSRGLSTSFYRDVLKGIIDFFYGNSIQV
ncbi:hypothetical protein HY449_00310 [Candidatus Pacearchaeota archaeon]|nr:hypothetical protein [Candidatus Pacearchaeota archaeon]